MFLRALDGAHDRLEIGRSRAARAVLLARLGPLLVSGRERCLLLSGQAD